MNVAQKMREILPILRRGLDGIHFPAIRPECDFEKLVRSHFPSCHVTGNLKKLLK